MSEWLAQYFFMSFSAVLKYSDPVQTCVKINQWTVVSDGFPCLARQNSIERGTAQTRAPYA